MMEESECAQVTGQYTSADFDKLLDQARVEPNTDRRVQLYRQAEQLLMSEAAVIPLWYGKNYYVVKTTVKGWRVSLQNIPDLVFVNAVLIDVWFAS